MVDARELGLEAILYAVAGTVLGVLVASIVLAVVAARTGGRRLGPISFLLSLAVVIAVLVVAVVAWRTVDGDATGWDLVWAVGLAAVGWSCVRRLVERRGAITGTSDTA